MKKQLTKAAGLLCYLIIISLLFDFNWILLVKPKPLLSVILGMAVLTASQYRREYTKEDLYTALRWNLLFASFLTTLISILSLVSSGDLAGIAGWQFIGSLLPMLYGSIIYLILSIVFNDSVEAGKRKQADKSIGKLQDLTAAYIAEQVFREFELTNRECHVALKLLENMSNKEIAAQLYISEATVKKHIQNIYQKFEAADRNSFREIYLENAQKQL
ncbi:MAG TPA: helix-turn-helix transcriptional regulator [Clostridia bacterium]|nr:helix-turn-helix transcriptional regulator [Clostridia bacterium]